MDSMELARKIQQKDEQIAIVFTTGIDDYIGEGYEVEALHYLLKPIRQQIADYQDDLLEKHCEEVENMYRQNEDGVFATEVMLPL